MASEEATRYLTLADVIALHRHVMERLGCTASPLRDEGVLESAIIRAQMAAYYENADVVRQCALLTIGISQAQAFVDGNKRTAYAVVRAFLRINGLRYDGDPMDLAQALEDVVARQGSLEEATRQFEAWFRSYVSAREPGSF